MVNREEKFQGTLQTMANEYRIKALEQQKEKEKEMLTLWHDMKHHMTAIQLMAIKRDDEQILKYVKDLLGEIGICENRLSTGIPILNGLFSEKIDDARREKIQMSVDLNVAALKFISDVDLCTIFGNALDNAIEACKKKEETEKRFVVVSAQHLAGCIVINIANSCYEMTFFNRKSQRTFTCQIVQNTKRHLKRAKTMQISGIGHSVIRGLVTTGQWFSASTTVYPRGSPQGRRHSYFVDC